jgi:formylmethanofuran dehydrogenase subunit E
MDLCDGCEGVFRHERLTERDGEWLCPACLVLAEAREGARDAS